jgi:hypothetical protein
MRLPSQRARGIDAGGTTRGEKTGDERNGEQNNQCHAERDRIARTHFVKQVAQQARQHQRRRSADHDSGNGQSQAARNDQLQKISHGRASAIRTPSSRVLCETEYDITA